MMKSRKTWTLPSISGDDDDDEDDDDDDDAKHLDPPFPLRWHRRAFRELALLQIIHQSHNDFFDNDNDNYFFDNDNDNDHLDNDKDSGDDGNYHLDYNDNDSIDYINYSLDNDDSL